MCQLRNTQNNGHRTFENLNFWIKGPIPAAASFPNALTRIAEGAADMIRMRRAGKSGEGELSSGYLRPCLYAAVVIRAVRAPLHFQSPACTACVTSPKLALRSTSRRGEFVVLTSHLARVPDPSSILRLRPGSTVQKTLKFPSMSLVPRQHSETTEPRP